MANIKESRNIIVEDKVLTSDDIRSLAQLFSSLLNEILEKSIEIERRNLSNYDLADEFIDKQVLNVGHIDVEISASDGSQYSGSVEDIIENGTFLSDRQVNSIRFYFLERNLGSKIYIKIQHSIDTPIYIEIEGYDRTWVNGCFQKFEDFFARCKTQFTFIRKYEWVIVLGLIVVISLLFLNIVDLIVNILKDKSDGAEEAFNIYGIEGLWKVIVLFAAISFLPALLILHKLESFWPTVELQTGRDFQQIERKRRNRIWNIILYIIVPTISSFLPLILKK